MHRFQSLERLATHPSASHAFELLLLLAVAVIVVRILASVDVTVVVVGGIGLEIFSGNWRYIPIPVPIDRALLAMTLLLLILRGTGWSVRRIVLQPIHFLLLAVAVYVFANGLWAGTILHSYGLYAWTDRLGAVPFLMYTLAPVLFGTARQRNYLLVGMVAVGAYLSLEGLVEGLGVHALVFPRYINDTSIGITTGRARGPFLASDAMGLALFDCGTFAALALTRWRSLMARGVCWGVIALSAVDIFFTLTRSVWIGAVLGSVAAMIWHPRLRRLFPFAFFGSVIVVAGLLLLVPGLSSKVDGRVSTTSSVWDRYNTNDAALRAVADHPLFGIGWQTFETQGILYLREAGTYPLTGEGLEVHNVFLSHLAEIGIFGAILWALAFFTGIAGAIVRRGPPELWEWRIALLAMAVLFLVVANLGPLSYALPNLLIWLMAGIVSMGRNSAARSGDQGYSEPPAMASQSA